MSINIYLVQVDNSILLFTQTMFRVVLPCALLIMTAALTFQVMLVGDSGVGKTCLLVRFKDGAFLAGSFISTVGIDFRVSWDSWLGV